LLRITDKRLPFLERRDQLAHQRQWLIDLEHLLDPAELPSQGMEVAERVDRYLAHLAMVARSTGDVREPQTSASLVEPSNDAFDEQVADHIVQTFRNRWWGLFTCYQVDGLPRTNNELETFLRYLKTGQRRVTGRKKVHSFIVRYGRYVAFLDPQESQTGLLERLSQVPYEDFVREREQLNMMLEGTAKRYRFRHRQGVFLEQLEDRWLAACAQSRADS